MSHFAWGEKETQYFYKLTPEVILNAVEELTGLRATGRVLQLNSLENRVYEVEIERDEKPKNPSENFVIVKFYRPGRWTQAQIVEEHEFLFDLAEAEIPAIAPLKSSEGISLKKIDQVDLWYAVFPKVGGRCPQELSGSELQQLGRLIGRMHNVGSTRLAKHRITLNCDSYGRQNLDFLLKTNILPDSVRISFQKVCESLFQIGDQLFTNTKLQRLHGDAHLGNVLCGREGFFWVDFDDMVIGPVVQDLWLVIPGRGMEVEDQWNHLIEGYEVMRPFDHRQRQLVECLRALRYIHFSAWIGKRWKDPAFPRAFPDYGQERYWNGLLKDLNEQLDILQNPNTLSFFP